MPAVIRAGFAASAALGLLLTGCSGDDSSPSPPAGAAEQPSGPSSPANGAPKVDDPLDTAPLEADPCSVIAAEQITSLGEPLETSEPDERECTWRLGTRDKPAGQVSGKLFSGGLASAYKQHQQGQFPDFQPVTIAGYPAVIEVKDRFSCTLVAGLRDDRRYLVTAQSEMDSPMRGNECQAAQKVTEFAINNLKGAS